MDGLIKFDDDLSILTRVPSEADLKELSASGSRSVVNLCAAGESAEILGPEAECEHARGQGVAYLSFPVAPPDLNSRTVTRFNAELENLPRPVTIHRASGKRAALMGLSHWAREHGASIEDAAEKAAAAGLTISAADLERLIGEGAGS